MEWEKVGDNWVVFKRDASARKLEDPLYQIHSADRMTGDNTGKFVALYDGCDINGDEIGGYLAWATDQSGQIWYCGGNAMFNAMGLPPEAEFLSVESAKEICEFHSIFGVCEWHSKIHPLLKEKSDYEKQNRPKKQTH
jgi:hypothetical protein